MYDVSEKIDYGPYASSEKETHFIDSDIRFKLSEISKDLTLFYEVDIAIFREIERLQMNLIKET